MPETLNAARMSTLEIIAELLRPLTARFHDPLLAELRKRAESVAGRPPTYFQGMDWATGTTAALNEVIEQVALIQVLRTCAASDIAAQIHPAEARWLLDRLAPRVFADAADMDEASVRELLGNHGPITFVPNQRDLDQVLDDLRQAGIQCGLQIWSATEVTAWLGNVNQATVPGVRAGGPIQFFQATGVNSIAEVAKWFRQMMSVPK